MAFISSTGNVRIKAIRALRQRRAREATGLFWIEGIRAAAEAIDSHAPIETLVVSPEQLTSDFALSLAAEAPDRGIDVLEVSPAVFDSLAGRENPQGIGAVVRQAWTSLQEAHPAEGLCWVALDRIADPGNLGTIIRTADAVGAAGVVLLGESTDPHDPAATRAAMGSLFALQLVRATNQDFLTWRAAHTVHLVGSSDRGAMSYRDASYSQPLVLLMGSERHGLPDDLLAACDIVVRLPMRGHSDSLNVAVATGVLLYEILARRGE
jgi:RNA methyltransferase, TrmH family